MAKQTDFGPSPISGDPRVDASEYQTDNDPCCQSAAGRWPVFYFIVFEVYFEFHKISP
jgi:hypothetical protein